MASQAVPVNQVLNKLKNKEIQLMKTNLNIEFNKTCKTQNIFPNYISIIIRNKSESARKTLKQAKTLWLKNEIAYLYKKKNKLHKTISNLKNTLKASVNDTEFKSMLSHVKLITEDEKTKKTTIQKKKLINLKTTIHPSQNKSQEHKFYPKLINLTNIQFEEKEKSILEKNAKYCPPISTSNRTISTALINCEATLNQIPLSERDKVRFEIVRTVEKEINQNKPKYCKTSNEKQTVNSIKEKLIENEAQLIPSDKSNSTVVINNRTLQDKVQEYLDKNGILESTDKTKTYNREIKEFLDNNNIIPPNIRNRLYNNEAQPPNFRPLIKTHKDGNPIRPVINAIPSPSYKISKFINNLIKENITIHQSKSCKNTKTFLNKLKQHKLEHNELMLTVDVDNMYGNIPRKEAIEILEKKLKESGNLDEEEIKDIINITNTITKQSYFKYENKIFYDPKGLPMGGPLSGTLAELFMDNFEQVQILSDKNPHSNKIKFYSRYVDDAFIILKANRRQASIFLNYLNSINPHMQFKLELEENNKINFLDVSITRKQQTNLAIGIYRKPTQTDLVIPADSNHPQSQKMAAFRSLIYRLLNYDLDPIEYKKEKSIIEQIALNNGYKTKLIDNIIKQMRKPKTEKPPDEQVKYVGIKYLGKISEKIGSAFKRSGYQPAYKTTTNPIPNYKSTTTEPPIEDQKGVYKIKCHNSSSPCHKEYIGYTNRTFKKRFSEHNSRNQSNPSSVVAKHLKSNPSHSITFPNSIEVISNCKNKNLAKAQEGYAIFKYIENHGADNLLNKKEDYFNSIIFKTAKSIEENTTHTQTRSQQPGATLFTPPIVQDLTGKTQNLLQPASSTKKTPVPVRNAARNSVDARPARTPGCQPRRDSAT